MRERGEMPRRRTLDLLVFVVVAGLAATAVLERARHREVPIVHADAVRTPGALNPQVTQATIGETICVRGWTATVRPPASFTSALKRTQMAEYGEVGPSSAFQEDHLISLELGGAPDDPRNLWPEPYPRAAAVDQIENQLNAKVCTGELTLADAQREEAMLKHERG